MNPDTWILFHLNAFAHHSQFIDTLLVVLSGSNLLKGGVMLGFFWCAWFESSEHQRDRRATLLAGIFGATAGVVIARAIALLAPLRQRPMVALPHFQLPYSATAESLGDWSSFPSDHATLFVGLAVAVLFVSRRLGLLALAYSIFFICLPRIYIGLHYPSDILAGALIGTGTVLLSNMVPVTKNVAHRLLNFESQMPGFFYMASFVLTAELVELLLTFRKVSAVVVHGMKGF